MRIAMWSGPRNLSTAMMYSFAQRPDCTVIDEPFYAAYLAETGVSHPMGAAILASQPQDPDDVITNLEQYTGHAIRYEKHMTHHILPGWNMDWLADVHNVFLIRHPARVIASYAAKRENPTADDLGFRQQFELFQRVKALGQRPIIIDSFDVRTDPKKALTKLCQALNIPFQDSMLTWKPGGDPADGVWAAHWYGAVHQSSGFAQAEGELPKLSGTLATLCSAVDEFYEPLVALKI